MFRQHDIDDDTKDQVKNLLATLIAELLKMDDALLSSFDAKGELHRTRYTAV